jgi:lipoate-protein ligase A
MAATGSREHEGLAIPEFRNSGIPELGWTLMTEPAGRPGWLNMALDLALLDLAERHQAGFVRLYQWEPFCLSFGRNEPARRRYDREAIRGRGLAVVRRPTGGRAVWHARELTYAVAAPPAWLGGGGLRETHDRVHGLLASALIQLGAPVEPAPEGPTPSLAAGPCFASSVGGELTVAGRKLAGSAQLRRGTVLLQHGSILLSDDQEMLADLAAVPLWRGRAITLSQALGRGIGFADAAAAIIRQLVTQLGAAPASGDLVAELDRRAAVHGPRFRDPEWTWRR